MATSEWPSFSKTMRAAKQYHNGALVQPAWATTLDLEARVDDYTSGTRRSPPALDGRVGHTPLNRDDYFQGNSMSAVTAKIKEEFLAMLPPTIFEPPLPSIRIGGINGISREIGSAARSYVPRVGVQHYGRRKRP